MTVMERQTFTGDQVVAEARAWVGTPFAHQGRLKGVGCDCIGLVVGVATAMGSPEAAAWAGDARYAGYASQPNPEKLLAACTEYLDPLPLVSVGAGDILLFRIADDPMHFGFVSRNDPRQVVHAWLNAGDVCEFTLDARWRKRIVRAYRLRGMV